jgi:hypothetical protein
MGVVMGLMRKTLRIATGGAVAARSKKQRTQAQVLAALQGKSEQEITAAGGRGFDFENQQKATQQARRNRPRGPKPVLTDEERAYMAAHVPTERREK